MNFKPFKRTTGILFLTTALLAGCSKSDGTQPRVEFKQAESSNPELAAKIGDKEITVGELDKNLKVFQAKIALYDARKEQLEEMASRTALEKVASKKNLSVEEYLEKESKNVSKVSDKELDKFLKKMGAPDNLPPAQKERARQYVHMQNVVAAATKGSKVDIFLKRPKAPELDINTEGEAVWGGKDAKVTILEFSDFQCPFCSRANDTIAKVKKEYGKKVKIVFKHFPLPMHPEAKPASEASMCINEQSSDKFWKFHDLLFENQQRLKTDNLLEYAKKVGADMKKFEECFKSKKYAGHVEKNMMEGQKIGVNSTPSFFVNGQPIQGARPLADFKELIDAELSVN